jgi:FimV-like protein
MDKVTQLFVFALLTIATVVVAEEVTTYGPIKSGELLWNVANTITTDKSVTRYQVMLALFKANPGAFAIPCNLHSLKAGKKLQVPALAEIQAVDQTEALKEATRQKTEWETYRKQPKNIVCPPQEKTSLKDMQSKTAEAVTPISSVPTPSQPYPEVTPQTTVETPKKREQSSVVTPITSSQPATTDTKPPVAESVSSDSETTPEKTTESVEQKTPAEETPAVSSQDSTTNVVEETPPTSDERLVPATENAAVTPPPVATNESSATPPSVSVDKPKPSEGSATTKTQSASSGSAVELALGVTIAVFLLAMLLSWLLRSEPSTRPIPGEEV